MDHTKFVTLAQRLINSNGRECRFDILASGPDDVSRPWRGAGKDVVDRARDLIAVFLPASSVSNSFGKEFIDSELLKRVSQVCIVAPVEGFPLEEVHRINDSAGYWKVDWISELKPGEVTVLWAFGVTQ